MLALSLALLNYTIVLCLCRYWNEPSQVEIREQLQCLCQETHPSLVHHCFTANVESK
jgi:hypothetical protein